MALINRDDAFSVGVAAMDEGTDRDSHAATG